MDALPLALENVLQNAWEAVTFLAKEVAHMVVAHRAQQLVQDQVNNVIFNLKTIKFLQHGR